MKNLLFTLFILIAFTTQAQQLNIHKKDGTTVSVGISDIDNITFSTDSNTTIIKPTIIISPSATIGNTGDVITYTIFVSSSQNLGTLIISPTSKSAGSITNDTVITFSNATHSKSIIYKYTIPSGISNAIITCTVTDEDASEIATQTLTVNSFLKIYSSIKIGGSISSFGSYLDVEAGLIYLYSDITTDASKAAAVDIVYNANTLKDNSGTIISSTGTKFFITSLSEANFDAVTSDATFGSYNATATSATIAAGTVVFFETKAGKKGLLKVTSIASATDDIVVAVKIQN